MKKIEAIPLKKQSNVDSQLSVNAKFIKLWMNLHGISKKELNQIVSELGDF